MSTVRCGKCGALVELPEKSELSLGMTVSKESFGDYVLPMSGQARDSKGRFCKKEDTINKETCEKENNTMTKTEKRVEMLKARGVDTSSYFSLTNNDGNDVLMKWENGVPVLVPEEDEDDPILNQIISDGYVRNTKLHRRWVMAQMFHALDYVGYEYEKNYSGQYVRREVRGYEAYVRRHGYSYQWEMMLEEVRVLSKLETRDKESFLERAHFFDKKVILDACIDYKTKLKDLVDGLKVRKCKGVPYKTISGRNVFVSDIESKVFGPINDSIDNINRSTNYAQIYLYLSEFINDSVKKYKLPSKTSFSCNWKDAYKGAGSFYTMKNLLMFHGCFIITFDSRKLTGSEAISYISSYLDVYKYEGWRFFAMMKKVIADNNFNYKKRMGELEVEGYVRPF